jgi:hypothetical protein
VDPSAELNPQQPGGSETVGTGYSGLVTRTPMTESAVAA